MFFWFCIVSIITTLSFLYKKKVLPLLWIMLTLLSAFRYRVGTDYDSYSRMFSTIIDGTAPEVWLNKEWGYRQLIHFSDYIGGNYQLVAFIMAVATMVFFCKGFLFFCKSNSFEFLLITILFVPTLYFYTFNGVRQALAVAIFFYSIKYVTNRDIIKYLFFVFISFLFHKSILFFLPLWWFLNIKYSKTTVLGFCAIVVIVSTTNILPTGLKFLISNNYLYEYYSNLASLDSQVIVPSFFNIFLPLLFLTAILGLYFLDRNVQKYNIIFNATVFFLSLKYITYNIEVINRLTIYGKPFFVIFMVYLLFQISRKINNSKKILFYSFFVLIFGYTLYGINYRAQKDETYNHYALNFCLLGDDSCPLQVYGDYNKITSGE